MLRLVTPDRAPKPRKPSPQRAAAEVVSLLDRIRAKLPPTQLKVNLDDPDRLLQLASMYQTVRDNRSVLTCIYLYTAIRHPDKLPPNPPTTLYLGANVLRVFAEFHPQETVCAPTLTA